MAIKQRRFPGSHHILFDTSLTQAADPSLFSPYYWEAKDAITGTAQGRGTTLFVEENTHKWVLRHYKRGGLIGRLLDDQYLYVSAENSRPFQEFRLLHAMRQLSLPVPVPVAAHIQRKGLIYKANLITALIENSVDLHQCLVYESLEKPLWEKIGQTIARFHQHQIYHHDLNVRNIMLDKEENVWLIDFDRCAQQKGQGWKQGNIDRLQRSFKKEQARSPVFNWSEADWQALISGYQSAGA